MLITYRSNEILTPVTDYNSRNVVGHGQHQRSSLDFTYDSGKLKLENKESRYNIYLLTLVLPLHLSRLLRHYVQRTFGISHTNQT